MISIKFDLSTKLVKELLESAKKDINDLVKKGADDILSKKLEELKRQLKNLVINETQVKLVDDKEITTESNITEQVITMSENEMFKYLFDVDFASIISDINKYNNYLNSDDPSIFVVFDGVNPRYRISMSETDTFNSQYEMAKKKFNGGTFIFMDNNKPRVVINNSIDLTPYVKIECSTTTGDTEDAKKVFDSYKTSQKRSKYLSYQGGRYAEWSINKHGMKRVDEEGIDITQIVDEIVSGNFEDAMELLKSKIPQKVDDLKEMVDKVDDLKEGKNLPQNIEAYSGLLKIIDNLKFIKSENDDSVNYKLVTIDSSLSGAITNTSNIIATMNQYITLWAYENSGDIKIKLNKKISQILNKYR